ncbi:hypothetical protein PMAYCL1PPCAC_32790, partial [Pristionchus mayeri]
APSIGYMDYSAFRMVRDSAGAVLMVFLLAAACSDPVLTKRYNQEMVFVGLLLANRISFVTRDIFQAMIPKNDSLPVHPLLCPAIYMSQGLLYHIGFAYAMYLAIAHFQQARRAKMFSQTIWMGVTTVLAILLFLIHAVTGKQYAIYNCCCAPLNIRANSMFALVDIAIHAAAVVLSLYSFFRATGVHRVVPLALLVFSISTFPYVFADFWITDFDTGRRKPESWHSYLWDAFFSRGDAFCLVLFVGLLVKDTRFRLVLRSKLRKATRGETVLMEEELISASEIITE